MNERQPANDESGNVPWLEPVPTDAMREGGSIMTPQVIKIGAALLTLLIFGALLWFLYARSAEVADPLLVRAPQEPTKVEPMERGGMDVPHQDKLVLDPGADDDAPTENLRPGPEDPMEKPKPVLAEAQSGATPPALPGEEPAVEEPSTTEPEVSDSTSEVVEEEAKPDPMPEPAPAPVQQEEVQSQSAPNAQSGAYLAQMGAFSTQANANSDWQRIQNGFPSAVTGLVSDIQPADRGGRTLYLLRAGPMADRAAVDRFCNALKAKGQGCFAVAN